MNPAAVSKTQIGREWMARHEQFVLETKSRDPDVLFIGDSLIEYMQMFDLWEEMFVPLNSINFGIGGDTTEHVLWRAQNGELDNIRPKVIVLLCGTNNSHKAEDVAGGIVEIVKTIRQKQPQSYCIVLGIPPKGKLPNTYRKKIHTINVLVEKEMPSFPKCTFQAIDPSLFVGSDGKINSTDMWDYLHLTQKGYKKFVGALQA